jgi:hypothetical protein
MIPYDPLIAIPGTISVVDKTITFTPTEPFEVNKEYIIIVTKDVADTDGTSLIADYEFSFQSKLSPMYCDIDTIIDDISPWLSNIPHSLIARYIYRSSIYVDKMAVDNPIEVINTVTGEAGITYEAQQFVRYDAAFSLLNRIYLGKVGSSGDSLQLADLVIKKSSTANVSIKDAMGDFKNKRQMWLDAIMGHHNRRYAKPLTAAKGANNTSPIPSRSWD